MNVRLRMCQVLLFKFGRHLCKGSMGKNETDCNWVILNMSAQCFSSLWQIALIKVVLSVKEFHITISSFKLLINQRFRLNTLK